MSLINGWMEKYLKGRDPLDTEVLWSVIYHDNYSRGGRLAMTALAGIDIALWDIKGKALNQPVYKLLGGAHRPRLRVYANGWYTNPASPETIAKQAEEVVGMGYTAMKFDPFGQGHYYTMPSAEAQLAEERVAAVREAVGPNVDVMVEAHAKFCPSTAIQLGLRLAKHMPFWYEEPVAPENIRELTEVRRQVKVPIATGEKLYTKFSFVEILDQEAADVLQPDIANAGGITELKKIAAIAEARHVMMAPHNVCSPVGAMAEIHFGLSTFNFLVLEYHAEFYSDHYFTVSDGFPRQKDGYVEIPDTPGLGITLREDEIAKHPPLEKTSASGNKLKGI
jgi:galactonate dehydratase